MYIHVGADTAFDRRILIDYFASRLYTYVYILIANKLAKAVETVKSVPAVFAQAFAPATLAAARV